MAEPLDIGALYDHYGDIVFRRCLRILGEEQSALDATQDVFLKALGSAEGFRGQASPTTWLYRISTNLCLNRLRNVQSRGHKRGRVAESAGVGSEALGEVGLHLGQGLPGARASERRTLVRGLLERADPQVREVVIYYYFDGMTHEEIGSVMGLSRPTVRKRLATFKEGARRELSVGMEGEAMLGALLLCLALL